MVLIALFNPLLLPKKLLLVSGYRITKNNTIKYTFQPINMLLKIALLIFIVISVSILFHISTITMKPISNTYYK